MSDPTATTADPSTADLSDAALEQLGALLDRSAIELLVHRLGACLDEGRFDDLRALLAPDAAASTPGGVAEGIDAVVDQARRNHDPDERIQHTITDVVIDLDADRSAATVRANLVVAFSRGVDTPYGVPYRRMGSVYSFDAVRTAEGWRLRRIGTAVVWNEGEPPPRRTAPTAA